MPAGVDPPLPHLPSGVFDALNAMTYDSTNLAFSSQGSRYFLFVEKRTGGSYDEAQWFYATDSEGGPNPKGLIAPITAAAILGGTYQASDQTIRYQSLSYRIRLVRDTSSGNQLAQAYAIS